jgi:hypothetical protein
MLTSGCYKNKNKKVGSHYLWCAVCIGNGLWKTMLPGKFCTYFCVTYVCPFILCVNHFVSIYHDSLDVRARFGCKFGMSFFYIYSGSDSCDIYSNFPLVFVSLCAWQNENNVPR